MDTGGVTRTWTLAIFTTRRDISVDININITGDTQHIDLNSTVGIISIETDKRTIGNSDRYVTTISWPVGIIADHVTSDMPDINGG